MQWRKYRKYFLEMIFSTLTAMVQQQVRIGAVNAVRVRVNT